MEMIARLSAEPQGEFMPYGEEACGLPAFLRTAETYGYFPNRLKQLRIQINK